MMQESTRLLTLLRVCAAALLLALPVAAQTQTGKAQVQKPQGNKAKPAATVRPSRAPVTVCESFPAGTKFTNPAAAPESPDVLWYRQPAVKWIEALAIGNGSMGGMVFGGITNDVLQFNHDTIWSKPKLPDYYFDRLPDRTKEIAKIRELIFAGKYREADEFVKSDVLVKGYQWGSYQPFATLEATYAIDVSGGVSGYRNQLDMATGVVETRYTVAGTQYKRWTFVAKDRNLILIHMVAEGSGVISGDFTLSRVMRNGQYEPRTVAADTIAIAGQAEMMNEYGTKFEAMLRAKVHGGEVGSKDGVLRVKDAKELTLLIAGATDYNKANPFEPLGKDLSAACIAELEAGWEVGTRNLFNESVAVTRALYDRVALRIGKADIKNDVPTDELIKRAKGGEYSPLLAAQAYQFGRYLLIASSRPGSMAANLQGLWNDRIAPPWYSDYHFNINVQANYWPAEVANLSECHLPFIDLLEGLVPGGQRVAKEMFGARGYMIPHATGAYFTAVPTGSTPYALWTMGAAWAGQHIMEHYRFSGDKKFLKERAVPLLRETALFCLDWLVPDPKTGKLISGPDVSPENTFVVEDEQGRTRGAMAMGCAMSQQMTWQIFSDYLEALKILGESDGKVEAEVRAAMEKLSPTVNVADDGRVMEWLENFKEAVPGHRHLSHLFAFSPGNQYHKRNAPELVAAAVKSVDERVSKPGGAGVMGWSAAHVNSLYARFGIGDKAYGALVRYLERNLFPNMMSIYPPDLFQIDGNFGYSYAVNEMLLQSHTGEIDLLPALPKAWAEGRVSGLKARGGFEVTMEWANGRLTDGSVKSLLGNPGVVHYDGKTVPVRLAAGESVSLKSLLNL